MKQRVLTALALAPLVLGALLLSDPRPFLVLAALTALVAGHEVSRLLRNEHPMFGLVAAGALLVLALTVPVGDRAPLFAILSLLGVGAAWAAARAPNPALVAPSLFWAVGPLLCLIALHSDRSATPLDAPFAAPLWRWQTPVLLAILPLWAGDTAAIFAGKAFGKRLLAPSISPKKTVEGALANLVACVATGALISLGFGEGAPMGAVCGALAGTLGQAGDLFESWLKRRADLKDSGAILPGHGGILDRIDSLLFTAPAVAIVVWLWTPR